MTQKGNNPTPATGAVAGATTSGAFTDDGITSANFGGLAGGSPASYGSGASGTVGSGGSGTTSGNNGGFGNGNSDDSNGGSHPSSMPGIIGGIIGMSYPSRLSCDRH